MNKIKFNNVEFEVEQYTKNTYFGGETINSNANCSITTDDISTLIALASTTITTLQIYHDDTLIYNLQNTNAKIESINEYLSIDRMNISVNLIFTEAGD